VWLGEFSIQNCRIIEATQVTFSPKLNLIIGDNASGKSSLLEALSILSRGRSYRSCRIQEVIRHHSEQLLCTAKIHYSQQDKVIPIGIERSAKQTTIRINQETVKQQASLSQTLPMTVIQPESVLLITGGPSIRRAFIDWIAFYQDENFYIEWKKYKRILKQRNHCLRDRSQAYALPYWTEQLIKRQAPLHQYRLNALSALLKNFTTYQTGLWKGAKVNIRLSTGLPQEIAVDDTEALEKLFATRLEQDKKSHQTFYGIHRSDLKISVAGHAAAKVVSRGQLKILAILLLIAQSASISSEKGEKGIIAIDDLTAELDSHNQQRLLDLLLKTQQQLIMTTTPNGLESMQLDKVEKRLFEVKQGNFIAL
jgi:DNA replication and repair protein RecF